MRQSSEGWTVIGHRTVSEVLRRNIQRGRVSHAYLFRGPGSVGKRTMAEWFAASLLCDGSKIEMRPCQECGSCRQWAAGVHPDFHRVEPQRSAGVSGRLGIGLEEIQELQSHLHRRPVLGYRRVALICGAQHLSEKAANALLKTLEEPRGETVLLLTWDGTAALPPTVPSRCQHIELRAVAPTEIAEALVMRGINRIRAVAMAVHAGGRPGRALAWLTQPDAYGEYQREVAEFTAMLRQPLSQRLLAVGELYRAGAAADEGTGPYLNERLQRWTVAARDYMLAAAGCHHLCQFSESIPELTPEHPEVWQRCVDAMSDIRNALSSNANARLCLEVLAVGLPDRSSVI